MKDICMIFVDVKEFQEKISDYITSDKIDKLLDNTIYVGNKECRSAMIYGMTIASMLTSLCNLTYVKSIDK